MVQYLIILRGPPGIGKTGIAKKLARYIPGNVSVVGVDILRYNLLPKRNKGFNDHKLVYKNLKDICKNSIKEGLSIIIEGVLASRDKNGKLRVDEFEKFSGTKVKVIRLFLSGSQKTQKLRLKKKMVKYQKNKIKEWTKLSISAITKKDHIIDTDNKSENAVIKEVIRVLKK